MVADAEARKTELLCFNEVDGPIFKMRNDPRLTRVGRIIRSTSLDELPQLWNVLRGEMSIVGPRPPLPAEVAEYEAWQRGRLAATGGVTGLWQVSGRSRLGFDEMVELDIQYIEEWSLWLDIVILAKTVKAVILMRGAY
jgi:lipopolysaccharide/colanic/teichoic acid biosynthesis glycosyltransferase